MIVSMNCTCFLLLCSGHALRDFPNKSVNENEPGINKLFIFRPPILFALKGGSMTARSYVMKHINR